MRGGAWEGAGLRWRGAGSGGPGRAVLGRPQQCCAARGSWTVQAALGRQRRSRDRSAPPSLPLSPQVTLIPTFDSAAMHRWYEDTHARHQALGITVLGSNSMVSMQDEAFPACKVEF